MEKGFTYFISFNFINAWFLPKLPPKPTVPKPVWLATPAPESSFSSYYVSTKALLCGSLKFITFFTKVSYRSPTLGKSVHYTYSLSVFLRHEYVFLVRLQKHFKNPSLTLGMVAHPEAGERV